MDRIGRISWRVAAPLLVILAGISWGMIGLFSHYLKDAGLNPLQITQLRCLVTAIALLCAVLPTDKKKLKIHVRDIWLFFGTGIVSIAFFNICYFICISESTLSVACTLLYTSPCFVMLLSCLLFHERFTAAKAVSVLAAMVGCAFVTGLMSGGGIAISRYALIAGLCSGLGYALYSIFGRLALRKYNWITVITYTFLFAAVALLPFGDLKFIGKTVFSSWFIMANALMLGLASTLLPFLMYTKGLEHMETGKAAILTFVEPMVAMIISASVFHENFSLHNVAGIVMIVLSISLLNWPMKGRKNLRTK